MRNLAAALVLGSMTACTTLVDDPAAFRRKKSTTLGLPGVLHHPTEGTGLGVNVALPSERTFHVMSGGSGARAETVNPDAVDPGVRKIGQRRLGLDLYAVSFPWKSSFFFWGAGLSATRSRSAYNEQTVNFALDATKTNVEWHDDALHAGLPFGFSVNTKENVTSMVGVFPQRLVQSRRTFLDDGTARAVDEAQRDATLGSFDEVRRGVDVRFLFMTGYSF